HIICKFLSPDQRAFEVDLDLKPCTGIRTKLSPGAASFDADSFQNTDKAPLRFLRDDTRLIESFDKTSRSTVKNGNFRSVDFHNKIIDTQRSDRRHQMFDRINLGLFRSKRCAKVSCANL